MYYHQLTRELRYAIYLGIQEGKTKKAIAQQIGVHSSTVCRELKRNSGKTGHYGWTAAHEKALERRERLPGNRSLRPELVREARRLLIEEDWSPQQISGYLKLHGRKISHETIYRMIRSDGSGLLASHCRHRMKYRHHIKNPRPTKVRSIPNRISIHDRPPEADGKRFGAWEMDLILGKEQKGAIENTNKLIRQYIHKDADFKNITEDNIKHIQYKINRRPRLILNFLTPKYLFFENIRINCTG